MKTKVLILMGICLLSFTLKIEACPEASIREKIEASELEEGPAGKIYSIYGKGDKLYCVADCGVYESRDEGDHWRELTGYVPIIPTSLTFEGEEIFLVGDAAEDKEKARVYEHDNGYPDLLVEALKGAENGTVRAVVKREGGGRVTYLAVRNGLYKKEHYGGPLREITDEIVNNDYEILSLVIEANGTIWLAVRYHGQADTWSEIFKGVRNDEFDYTWQPADTGIEYQKPEQLVITSSGQIFARTPQAVYQWKGASWEEMKSLAGRSTYLLSSQQYLYLSEYRLTDEKIISTVWEAPEGDANNWSQVGTTEPAENIIFHSLAEIEGVLVAGSEKGVYKKQANRFRRQQNEHLCFSSLQNPSGYPPVVAGPNGILVAVRPGVISQDNGDTWRNLNLPFQPDWLKIDPKDERRMYVGKQDSPLMRTANGGESWEEIGTYTDLFEINPDQPNVIYSRHGMSTDYGSSWRNLPFLSNAKELVIAGEILYFTQEHGLYRGNSNQQTARRIQDGIIRNLALTEIDDEEILFYCQVVGGKTLIKKMRPDELEVEIIGEVGEMSLKGDEVHCLRTVNEIPLLLTKKQGFFYLYAYCDYHNWWQEGYVKRELPVPPCEVYDLQTRSGPWMGGELFLSTSRGLYKGELEIFMRTDEQKKQPPAVSENYHYPNPFNPECYIPVNAKGKRQNVKCKIYNILGQLVREIDLQNSPLLRGVPSRRLDGVCYWDGRDSTGSEVASGVYFYEVEGEGVRKMIVLR